MFGLFGNKKTVCPVSEDKRIWIEEGLSWLKETFGGEMLLHKKVLIPDFSDFPINYNGTEASASETMGIIARQMDVAPEEIQLNIYSEGRDAIDTGGMGNRIFVKRFDTTGGLFWGKKEDGKYHIGLEDSKLQDPESMVAVMAHEIAHIKLLGEERLKENDEPLTDLTTVIFGLGVFHANAAFKVKNSFDSWGYEKLGYLSQMEWGYALAYYAKLRNEKNADWIKHLTTNVRADYKKSENFINENNL